MADYRALAIEANGFGQLEISDADKLLVGNVAPSSGNLTIGGATAADGVVIDAGNGNQSRRQTALPAEACLRRDAWPGPMRFRAAEPRK